MPLISRKGKYCSKNSQDWALLILIGVVLLLVVALILTVIFLFGGQKPEQPPVQTTQPTTAPQLTEGLQLPTGITVKEGWLPHAPAVEDLVTGLDGTGITAAIGITSENSGWNDVSIRFESKTQYCVVTTRYYRFELVDTVTVDMDDDRVITIADFIPDELVQAQFEDMDPQQVDRNVPGKTALTIRCDGRVYTVTLDVWDDIAPTGTGVKATIEALQPYDPADFVKNIVDHSDVTVTFAEEVDLTVVGKHTVKLRLTDAYGNTAIVESTITVTPARLEPEFSGLKTIYIQVGDSISYKSGVTCIDPQDGALSFTVDNSGVDRMTEGRYTVYYTATDSDGHTVTVSRTVVVETITQEKVEEYAWKVLNKIITEGMTRDQQIYAVYQYSLRNVTYSGTSDKSSIMKAAYDGFTTFSGDCYTYYAMNTVMLGLLGIENLEVRRVGGTSNHWWNLVLFEDGIYYHVDSTPAAVTVAGVNHGKMTEADLLVYTADPGVVNRRPNFYIYDHDLPQYQDITIAQ